MAWAYFCWRDGGGFVTSTFPPTAGLAVCCGCRIFGGLPSAGQNDRGGFPRPQRDYGGFLTGGPYLLFPDRQYFYCPICFQRLLLPPGSNTVSQKLENM
ncbi:hypothetical protein NDU88_004770 [Pleurodeles waltl]|uniref:Uncharacterized protein n=1 Tax=Pleurodeles waltl TaxID=8319 RepID=A0AAV7UG48_PLEWA|nr:hypothetical protein NDU88_004770 [Pleurodeles waltl]